MRNRFPPKTSERFVGFSGDRTKSNRYNPAPARAGALLSATPRKPCQQHENAAVAGTAVTAQGTVRHRLARLRGTAGRGAAGLEQAPHRKENAYQNKPVVVTGETCDRPKGGNRRGAVAFLQGYRPYPKKAAGTPNAVCRQRRLQGKAKGLPGTGVFVPGEAPSTKTKGRPAGTSEIFSEVFGRRETGRVAHNALARPGRAGWAKGTAESPCGSE